MTASRREIDEGHLVAASDPDIHVMNLAGEAIRGEPLRHGVGVQKGLIHSRRRRAEDAMQTDGVGGHDFALLWLNDLNYRDSVIRRTSSASSDNLYGEYCWRHYQALLKRFRSDAAGRTISEMSSEVSS